MQDLTGILLDRRNADGGWGYYPGQTSWLEPTAYAALALHGRPESARAIELLRKWQTPSGAWLAHPSTSIESWATSLVVVVKCVRNEFDGSWRQGVEWVLRSKANFTSRFQAFMDRVLGRKPAVVQDPSLFGWPWCAGTASWIEPTAHALRALRLSSRRVNVGELHERVSMGERMIMDRRCTDHGWNYGNKRVLDENLESFPECTALALIGLCGSSGLQLSASLERLEAEWRKPQAPLSEALLRIALRMHGVAFEDRQPRVSERSETTQLALSLIGAPDGAWRLWKGVAA